MPKASKIEFQEATFATIFNETRSRPAYEQENREIIPEAKESKGLIASSTPHAHQDWHE